MNKFKHVKTKRGFTLIELTITMALLAIFTILLMLISNAMGNTLIVHNEYLKAEKASEYAMTEITNKIRTAKTVNFKNDKIEGISSVSLSNQKYIANDSQFFKGDRFKLYEVYISFKPVELEDDNTSSSHQPDVKPIPDKKVCAVDIKISIVKRNDKNKNIIAENKQRLVFKNIQKRVSGTKFMVEDDEKLVLNEESYYPYLYYGDGK